MRYFFSPSGVTTDRLTGNHLGLGAYTAHYRGEPVLRQRSDFTAHVYDFGGLVIGSERRQHAAARERHVARAQTEERMSAGVDAILDDGGYRARGVHGKIAAHQHHAHHVTGHEFSVVRLRLGGSSRGCDHAVGSPFGGVLANRRGRKSRKNQRRGDGFKKRAARQARILLPLLGQRIARSNSG